MITLFDLDSLIYQAVHKIVSIQDMRALLNVQRDEIGYKERKEMASQFIIDAAYDRMGRKVLEIYDQIEKAGYDVKWNRLFITNCKNNFRKVLSPEYKVNRKKNIWVNHVRKRLVNDGLSEWSDTLEADDLIADAANEIGKDGYIIISIDKDLKQIPGVHFDFYPIYKVNEGIKTKVGVKGLSITTDFDGWKMVATQVLMGDATDGIRGLPKVGIKTAEKILKCAGSCRQMLFRCVRAYAAIYPESWRHEILLNYRLIKLGNNGMVSQR